MSRKPILFLLLYSMQSWFIGFASLFVLLEGGSLYIDMHTLSTHTHSHTHTGK